MHSITETLRLGVWAILFCVEVDVVLDNMAADV